MEAKSEEKINTKLAKSNKIHKFILAFTGEFVLLLFLISLIRLQDPSLNVIDWFHNPVSEWIVYGSMLIMLLITGMFTDFLRSFTYTLKLPEEITAQKLKRSLFSIKLAMVTAVVSELLVLVHCFVSMMISIYNANGSLTEVLPNLLPISSAILGGNAIYGIVAIIILLPVYARVKIRLISL